MVHSVVKVLTHLSGFYNIEKKHVTDKRTEYIWFSLQGIQKRRRYMHLLRTDCVCGEEIHRCDVGKSLYNNGNMVFYYKEARNKHLYTF